MQNAQKVDLMRVTARAQKSRPVRLDASWMARAYLIVDPNRSSRHPAEDEVSFGAQVSFLERRGKL